MKTAWALLGLCAYALAAILFMEGCRKTPAINTTPLPLNVPAGFPQPSDHARNIQATEEGFELGRKLFHDGRLSIDGNFPCSSCHQQLAAFTTFEHDRSHGYNGSHTLRNATALMNLAWQNDFFADGSAASLAAVIEKHITDPVEMANSISVVVERLQNDADYRLLFQKAFGDDKVTGGRVYNALSQYLVQLVSADSKYDRVKKGTETFTVQESRGYQIFQSKCSSCHREPLFTDHSFRNVGLPVDRDLKDAGRMRATGNIADSLKFRVPSLRNVDATSYYAHDGRFSMMRMMIRHYRSGVQASATLDPLVAGGIQMTDGDEDDLVAFLRTLTDSSFIKNTRFQY